MWPTTRRGSEMNVTVMEPPTTWGYEVGACVTHKDGPMPALVERRVRASNGMEIYGVHDYSIEDQENRDHVMMGEKLVAVEPGGSICLGGKLFETLACPGWKALKRLAAALLIILPPLAYTTAVSAVSLQPTEDSFDQVARVKIKNNAAINLVYFRRA